MYMQVNSELLPDAGSSLDRAIKLAEWVFTSIFALELLFNMFGHWCAIPCK